MIITIAYTDERHKEGAMSYKDPIVAAHVAAGLVRAQRSVASVVCCDDSGEKLEALLGTSHSAITPEQMKIDVLGLARRWAS